ADRGGGEGVGEGEALLAEPVQVRCARAVAAEAADGVDTMLIGHDHQHVAHVLGDPAAGPGSFCGAGCCRARLRAVLFVHRATSSISSSSRPLVSCRKRSVNRTASTPKPQ